MHLEKRVSNFVQLAAGRSHWKCNKQYHTIQFIFRQRILNLALPHTASGWRLLAVFQFPSFYVVVESASLGTMHMRIPSTTITYLSGLCSDFCSTAEDHAGAHASLGWQTLMLMINQPTLAYAQPRQKKADYRDSIMTLVMHLCSRKRRTINSSMMMTMIVFSASDHQHGHASLVACQRRRIRRRLPHTDNLKLMKQLRCPA